MLFIGGEFTNVYARHYGSRSDLPPQLVAALEPAAEHPAAPIPPPSQHNHRLTSGAAGVTVGVAGTVGLSVLALALGVGRALRRLWTK